MDRSEKCRESQLRRWAGRREFWKELIERQAGSGMSIAAFCRKEGVHATSFFQWRRKLRGNESPASTEELCRKDDFVQILLEGEETACHESGVRIVLEGVTVLVDRRFDAGTLRSVLALVRGMA